MEVIAIEMTPKKSGLNKEFPMDQLYGLRFPYNPMMKNPITTQAILWAAAILVSA